MTDKEIVALYWQREEAAIAATRDRYGPYLFRIARAILPLPADCEECVNDTYLGAWNSIPPQKPAVLQTYLGKLTRRIAIDRFRRDTAQKRGGAEVTRSLEELRDCLPARNTLEQTVEARRLAAAIRAFLGALSTEKRRVFLMRYWYSMSIREISARMGCRDSKTVNLLSRMRKALRQHLEQEAFFHE